VRGTTTSWTGADYRAAIADLCHGDLEGHALLIASNRGPVEFRREPDGRFTFRRGQGGLVTALSSMAEALDTTWIASPMSGDDLAIARRQSGPLVVPMGDRELRLAFVPTPQDQFRRYYDGISNSLLWFVQHGLCDASEHPEFDEATWSAWEDYRAVNLAFAQEIARHARDTGKKPIVMVQDYHLFLVPLFLRRLLPEALLHHFTHIPWPGPDAWRQLPVPVREELVRSLLSCDLVGFHTRRYAQHFLQTCTDLLDLPVESGESGLWYQGRPVQVRAYPISVDPDELRAFAAGPMVRSHEGPWLKGGFHILQVARTDPSKNILRSLKALDLFLSKHPPYHGKVRFWGILPASRQGSERYRAYLDRVRATAEALNRKYRRWSWHPVELSFDNSYERAIAAMKHYDVLVVNSLADGMNLVAKEGPVVNERHGVLLLSETAGAYEELGDGAIALNPYDLVGMADALHQALTMPIAQRRRRQEILCRRIEENPIFRWVHAQLVDLRDLLPDRRTRLWMSPFYRDSRPLRAPGEA
jgi:trehalose 6-phosphate synthase